MERGGKLGTESRQVSFAGFGPETVQRDAVGDQAQLGLMLAQERAPRMGGLPMTMASTQRKTRRSNGL